MDASQPHQPDQRLLAAQTLLQGEKALPSGLGLLMAAGALLVSVVLMASVVSAGPKAVAASVQAAPQADFQLSGSAFPDAQSAPALPSGSEPTR
ncbi:MAG: hypothetical protein ACTHLA_08300 [Asticcacaulis sp.]|uniref:hypothetical protein n=1 Tax=Asticcacaulis sp. TaxID=1872648 RepID=UPI003F7CC68F